MLEPVDYVPYIEYRGRVLWIHHSDAMDVAQHTARLRGRRHAVTAFKVHGHGRPLWWVRPVNDHGMLVYDRTHDDPLYVAEGN